jgi:hypothetical protein
MVCNAEPVVVNQGLLFCVNGSEAWPVILSMWLLIIMCIAAQVIANHGELC